MSAARNSLEGITEKNKVTTFTTTAPDIENQISSQPSLSIQLNTPLVVGENSNATALRILHAMQDKTASINWSDCQEVLVAISAVLVAMSSASTGYSFSENIVGGFFKNATDDAKQVSTLCIATPAILAQFCYSMNSNLTLAIKIKRHRARTTKSIARELWEQKLPLFIILPSIFGVVVNGKAAFINAPTGIMITICTLRTIAALGANMDYYLQKQKNKQGLKSIPSIRLILAAQSHLNTLAKYNDEEYIKLLSRGNLINLICGNDVDTPQDRLEEMFELLLNLVPADHKVTSKKQSKCIEYTSLFLGGVASLMNWKTATKVPGLFRMKIPGDLSELYTNFNWDYMPGFALGALYFGLPSAYVNTAIYSISCARLLNAFGKVKQDICEEGFFPYIHSFSCLDWIRIVLGLVVFSLAYGLSNGGSAYLYPFLDVLKIPLAIFAIVVFTAIGFMSFDSAGNNISNYYHLKLFYDFLNSKEKEKYFENLDPEKQQKLVILANTYCNLTFDTILNELNILEEDKIESLFSEDLYENMSKRFDDTSPKQPANPQQTTDIAPTESRPSQAGMFSASGSKSDRTKPLRIPRVISTNKLNPPPFLREQISPFPHSMPRVGTPIETVTHAVSNTPS